MKALYFAHIQDPALFDVLEFYLEDVTIMRGFGFAVERDHLIRTAMWSEADIVYAWWGASALPVLLACRVRGRKSILTGAIGFRDAGDKRGKRWLRSILILVASRVADCTLAISNYELRDLHKFGIRDARLGYLSVDTEFFAPGVKSARPTAVTVGQLNVASIARKGIDTAIAACSMVRRSVPDFELTVAGMITEDGRDWLASARQRYDFSGINVVGNVSREQKRALLQSAWLYLQPSRYEAFGVAMVEALACGTPAVHSQGGALPEIAATGGIPVDGTCSPEKLAEAIVQTLASAGIVGDMAEKARARSLVFRRDAREEALESAFRSVLGDAYPIRGDGRST